MGDGLRPMPKGVDEPLYSTGCAEFPSRPGIADTARDLSEVLHANNLDAGECSTKKAVYLSWQCQHWGFIAVHWKATRIT